MRFLISLVIGFAFAIWLQRRSQSLVMVARAVLAGTVLLIVLEGMSGLPHVRERALATPSSDFASALLSSDVSARWHTLGAAVSTMVFPLTWPLVLVAAWAGAGDGGVRPMRAVGAVLLGFLVLGCSFTGYLRPLDMSNPPSDAQMPSFFRFVLLHLFAVPMSTVIGGVLLCWRLASKKARAA